MTDARAMTEQTSVARWLAMGLVAIGVAGAVWLAVGSSHDTPEVMREARATPAAGQGAIETKSLLRPSPDEPITPPPDHHIEESGRLSLDAMSLPAGGVVTLGLALDKKALDGERALSAIVVSAGDGRRLELSATPGAGLKSGVRLE